jgi:hypothetical protein
MECCSWPVNENEIWLLRTFVNVDTVTDDVEILVDVGYGLSVE